ncbi:MAG TPA: response regulator transcription factor [Frankiaceae bacterium]|nr:response regulator transcription factor [Frankiaceae bacterium]
MSERPSEQTPALDGPIRVVLVDDHRLVRSGVRSELEPDLQVVGEAGTVEEAVAMLRRVVPDVVLLDVHLPGGGGAEVVRQVRGDLPEIRFLALSVSDAAEDVIGVVRSGARGYVTKAIDGPALSDAVRRVAGGDAVFGPRLAGFVLDAFSGPVPPGSDASVPSDPELDSLTPRERDVLRLIARGYTYREAAAELVLSARTIESHVSAALRKLQLSNRRELTRWATGRPV